MRVLGALIVVLVLKAACAAGAEPATRLRGEVTDAQSGKTIAARLYIRSAGGKWFFARSAAAKGSAVRYEKQRFKTSVEIHTTLSAHAFVADLPRGKYTITAVRGKEYLPIEKTITVGEKPATVKLPLRRWIDMASAGWYSGDTHVHRTLADLPNVMTAEDLNVALPLTYWVTVAYRWPSVGDKTDAKTVASKPIHVDATHVIYPTNTEYEIFSVGGKRHTLGAVFILGHKEPFATGVPPVGPIAQQARREGALLDLDKHSWPWSMMLVPVMKVDLFELANNHVWRTEFGFRRWGTGAVPAYMKLQRDQRGVTEWGWLDFGFQAYYALLNCGFRMQPTAGTASGVHPVPLGFGRVYVHLSEGFSYAKWMAGLGAGRSFVTTGPMLTVQTNGRPPGATIRAAAGGDASVHITGMAASARPLRTIEIIVNGRVADRIKPANRKTARGGYESPVDRRVKLDGSSWLAVRTFEDRPDKRIRFAHTSPVHVQVPRRPLRPRREEVNWLIRCVKNEIARNNAILRPDALAEYRQALAAYEKLLTGDGADCECKRGTDTSGTGLRSHCPMEYGS